MNIFKLNLEGKLTPEGNPKAEMSLWFNSIKNAAIYVSNCYDVSIYGASTKGMGRDDIELLIKLQS